MKLKITDEKLDYLIEEDFRVTKYAPTEWAVIHQKRGFRAAESFHQFTIDKLMQIIEMQNSTINSCVGFVLACDNFGITKIEVQEAIGETVKMLNELNQNKGDK